MKTIAVTAAFDWDREILERVVDRFQYLNGITTVVLDSVVLPNWKPRHWGWTMLFLLDYLQGNHKPVA